MCISQQIQLFSWEHNQVSWSQWYYSCHLTVIECQEARVTEKKPIIPVSFLFKFINLCFCWMPGLKRWLCFFLALFWLEDLSSCWLSSRRLFPLVWALSLQGQFCCIAWADERCTTWFTFKVPVQKGVPRLGGCTWPSWVLSTTPLWMPLHPVLTDKGLAEWASGGPSVTGGRRCGTVQMDGGEACRGWRFAHGCEVADHLAPEVGSSHLQILLCNSS